jgi:hypothetical protein
MTLTTQPSPEQFALQREFFRIDDETADRVRRLKPRLMAYAAKTLETLFDHLLSNPEVGDYFDTPENVKYLQAGMLAHCDLSLSTRFDAKYYEAIDQMGLRHSKLDYPSHAYSSAYANLLSGMVRLGLTDRRKLEPDDIEALFRVSIYDMELTIAAFFRHQLEKQKALNADSRKVLDLLEDDRRSGNERRAG